MSALLVRAVGGPVLVQDAGRPGHAAIGVGSAGAADRASYTLGGRLVGNEPGAAALEVVLGGLEVEADGHVTVCVTGAPAPLEVDGRPEPSGAVLTLRPGQRLRLGTPASGLRSYLSVRGGLELPALLGSRARDTLAGLGPEPVRVGAVLPVGTRAPGEVLVDAVPPSRYDAVPVVRVVRGPRDDWAADPDTLVTRTWRVGGASDRVGLRLEGDPLGVVPGKGELPSEGALRGAVQLPPDGRPVVFGPDHPVTGGYPVIAVVVDADTDRLAQLRPGEELRFRWV
ncbi:allophanate hydrolase [Nocardioides aromaticivorans]|uniref:Allophanate hydrolase n=1 Tax=Nocardioides aromaticivorans TaxID=200618 RepID=A0ABX7PJ65_9ACTN|nr:biotin-dependent carboxyltransferase family protein [Nocardioides aromaticivorans]QSR25964.1 allophanate hydrolase [Nocardioides aromaticivorans]